jgi:hypothetical protein
MYIWLYPRAPGHGNRPNPQAKRLPIPPNGAALIIQSLAIFGEQEICPFVEQTTTPSEEQHFAINPAEEFWDCVQGQIGGGVIFYIEHSFCPVEEICQNSGSLSTCHQVPGNGSGNSPDTSRVARSDSSLTPEMMNEIYK